MELAERLKEFTARAKKTEDKETAQKEKAEMEHIHKEAKKHLLLL